MNVWPIQKLDDVTESISTAPFGTMLHKSDDVVDGIPLVNPVNIDGVTFNGSQFKQTFIEFRYAGSHTPFNVPSRHAGNVQRIGRQCSNGNVAVH